MDKDNKQILELPIKIKSLNITSRMHWAAKKRDKQMYALLVRHQMRRRKIPPAKKTKHTLTIISYRKRLLDKDNLYGGCKQLIDAMCDEKLIYDDSPEYLDLKVEQYKSKEETTMIIRSENEDSVIQD